MQRAITGANARWLLCLGATSLLFACRENPPSPLPAGPDSVVVLPSAHPPAAPSASAAEAPRPVETASAAASATAAPSASSAAPEPPPHIVDMKNKAKPAMTSADLDTRAKLLFEAIAKDDADHAPTFFFPREPFLPLKDIKDPGKYWDQLFRIYKNDIHELHRKHAKSLEGAEFVSFELGSPPTYVKPGEEANKIGYYRTFHAKLRYKKGETTHTLEVMTIISWDEAWYCTHLLPIKH